MVSQKYAALLESLYRGPAGRARCGWTGFLDAASRLDGQVARRTGSSRGLGRAMAVAWPEAGRTWRWSGGAKAELESDRGDRAARGPAGPVPAGRRHGGRARSKRAVERILGGLGAARRPRQQLGPRRGQAAGRGTPEEWRAVLVTNLTGASTSAGPSAPHMIARRRARSSRGLDRWRRACPGTPPTRRQGRPHRPHPDPGRGVGPPQRPGERIAPGWFVTPMNAAALADERTRSDAWACRPGGSAGLKSRAAGRSTWPHPPRTS